MAIATIAAAATCAAFAADEETAAIVARSDIAIGQPNVLPMQAMGLGNGRLGAAFWAADGLTLQLNRADTLPYRRSPGQIVFPDLKPLVADRGFSGRVDLYDGVLEESGGGITMRAWVDRFVDRVVIDLSGLPTGIEQRVRLHLWEPRQPIASADERTASLAETWRDDRLPGRSGRSFGSLAAITTNGRERHARVVDPRTVEVASLPNIDGRLRVIVAAPAFDDSQNAPELVRRAFETDADPARSSKWWHAFWKRVDLIRAESNDGAARYAEAQRMLFLFASAAHNADGLPGSQAGIADLFSSSGDDHFWDPAAFWFWNLRMQVGANLAAGVPELNEALFALYRKNLAAIRDWTKTHAHGKPGICVPETMRFNGNGVEYESDRFRPFPIVTHSCDLDWTSEANARTLSSGAEIGLWIWRTWKQTRDRAFLEANYPLMAESARFLLAYQKPDSDGMLHTSPSNAHETQSDVRDPATDIAAIRVLFPATIAAGRELHRDGDLARRLESALARTPGLPLMNATTRALLQQGANLSADEVVFAASYDAQAPYRNGENIGLEAVWPYGLVGRDQPKFDIARNTFSSRPFVHAATWSSDPIQAAYLERGDDAAKAIMSIAQLHQAYPNGMAALIPGPPNEFYIEESGVTALALSLMLALQDPDGSVRVGRAIPRGWTMSGRVSLRDRVVIDVEAIDGVLARFALHSGAATTVALAAPWPGHTVRFTRSGSVRTSDHGPFTIQIGKDETIRFESVDAAAQAPVFGRDEKPTVKSLGRATIGIGPPCCAAPNGYDPDADVPAR